MPPVIATGVLLARSGSMPWTVSVPFESWTWIVHRSWRPADDGADAAVEAGVVAGDPVAEAEAVAQVRRALGHEAGALLRGADEVQRGGRRLGRSGAGHERGGREGGGGAGAEAEGEAGLHVDPPAVVG